MEISPRASMEEERRRGAAPAVERKESERLTPDSRGIYTKFSPSGVSGPWPEYTDSPEFSGPGPETPALPEAEQKRHEGDLIR